jgi:tetratricopeptide (TPR) repeat protein
MLTKVVRYIFQLLIISPNFFKYIYVFLLLLFHMQLYAKDYTIAEINHLQNNESKRLKKKGEHRASILLDQQLVKSSDKMGYVQGVIRGYLNLANTLCTLNQYEKSLNYLDYVEAKSFDDAELKSLLYNEYGRIYSQLGLHKQSNRYFNRAIKFANQITGIKKRKNLLYFSYAWKLGNFEKMQKPDSAAFMQRKCLKLSPEPVLFIKIAEDYLQDRNIDSAEYYLKKASLIIDKYPVFQKSILLRSYGRLCNEKKDYQNTLRYCFSSLAISKKIGRKQDIRDIYKLLCLTYSHLGDSQNKNIYLEKYIFINDELNTSERRAISLPLEKILDEKEKIKENKNKSLFVGIGAFLVGTLSFITLRKINLKKRPKLLGKIQPLDIFIAEPKPQISLVALRQLAIENAPIFIIKFEEFFPQFCNNLKTDYQLTSNDIRFCALVKLNFSNKEIAQYAFLSIRTVESKKYRLRKKIGMPADMDFNKWIMDR